MEKMHTTRQEQFYMRAAANKINLWEKKTYLNKIDQTARGERTGVSKKRKTRPWTKEETPTPKKSYEKDDFIYWIFSV